MTSNEHIRTSKGKNDELYTPRYAVETLLKYLEQFRGKIIWCPFDKENSEFVKVFKEKGFDVVYSHIDFGQDFFKYEPEKWDLIVSNPPFTNKAEIFRRALSFNKPFALLMTILWLNDGIPAKIFKEKNLQILSFDKRITYKNCTLKRKINFMSAYFCHNFLPQSLIFKSLTNENQMKLF